MSHTKERILELLEGSRGQSVSGQSIADKLQVSRNAVWKAIKELENDGYAITAVSNKGYCLSKDNDILSAAGILPYLVNEEYARQIFVHECLDSTNQMAKEMALSGVAHGTVVIADHQTSGKGRYGRPFHSPSGTGIYMSLILDPAQLQFDTPTLITASTAVSVCESIEAISDKRPLIKWVNDIFIDGKKICGILTEGVMDFESGTTQWIVVGIGINFNRPSDEDVPDDLREIVGTIFADTVSPTSRNHLIAEIVNRIVCPDEHDDEKEMLAEYKRRMFMLNERVLVTQANEQFEATALDVDSAGQLIVRADDGEVLTLSAGEVSVRPHM
ncbi:MAG: biotin--[acetyl-CoA-carboxylase] ligase [Coriobacteriia bacterium]|nr:biotin--[acetyl-CoA-carboxylase] ligase [Coriobacteriia bacterium]MCL2606080.1 biotin--[acetyl-CoA-carboxylase] ligase [Coriobacteriia bacterium]